MRGRTITQERAIAPRLGTEPRHDALSPTVFPRYRGRDEADRLEFDEFQEDALAAATPSARALSAGSPARFGNHVVRVDGFGKRATSNEKKRRTACRAAPDPIFAEPSADLTPSYHPHCPLAA